MIGIADSRGPLDRALLDAPGGFAWWYMDLVDQDGSGCVLIWSFGLPFLPGREAGARRGTPRTARRDPSLNIAVYERGRPVLYLLQEHPEADAWWVDPEGMRIGRSTLSTATVEGRRRLHARLDVDLPDGSVLTGELRMDAPACVVPEGLGGDPRHQWSPLCTAGPATLDLHVDGEPFLHTCGRGYHDRNGSTEPLGSLGIKHWLWGRVPVGDGERIWYLLWPERGAPQAWGLEVDAHGTVRVLSDLQVTRSGPRLGWFGMPWWRRLELQHGGQPWLTVVHQDLVDNGFFYLRWLVQGIAPDGQTARGVAEAVRPRRVDRTWSRWLVRMAVHRTGGPNSPFLPLFSGIRRRPAALPAPPDDTTEEVPA